MKLRDRFFPFARHDLLFELCNARGCPNLYLHLSSGTASSHEGLQSEVLRALQCNGSPGVHQPLLHQGKAEGRPGFGQELTFSVTALEAEATNNLTPNELSPEAPRASATVDVH